MQKNQTLHAGIKCAPFKATYGSDSEVKLEANLVPKNLKPLLYFASTTIRSSLDDLPDDDENFDPENELVEEMPHFASPNTTNTFEDVLGEDESMDHFESAESDHERKVQSNEDAISKTDQLGCVNQVLSCLPVDQLSPLKQPRLKKRKNLVLKTSSESSSDEETIVSKNYSTRQKRRTVLEAIVDRRSSGSAEDLNGEQECDFENDSNEEFLVCCVCGLECGGAHKCKDCMQPVHAICGEIQDEEEGYGSNVLCTRCKKKFQFQQIHDKIVKNTSQQAKRMLQRSKKKFPEATDSDNVVIRIPSNDRTNCEFQNLIGNILGLEDGLYRIGCRAGYLRDTFARNAFEKCPTQFLTIDDVPKRWVSLRFASTIASVDGKAQGSFKCNCKKSCAVGRCKCKNKGLFCNSKCHGSNSCDNK